MCRVWVGFLANTLIVTAPLLLAQNPVSVITETVNDAKRVRTGRGKLFLILSAFFFVEGLGILAQPNLAQRVCCLCGYLPPRKLKPVLARERQCARTCISSGTIAGLSEVSQQGTY